MCIEVSLKEKMFQVIGAAMEVHTILGPGLLEKAYGDALEIELRLRGIPFEREKQLPINYKGQQLATKYYADFVCYGDVIVELKAVEHVLPIHRAQVMHYMNITQKEVGVLLNFHAEKLYYDRLSLYY